MKHPPFRPGWGALVSVCAEPGEPVNQHTTASCLAASANFRLIDKYGIAFFDRHLKHLPEPVLDQKDPALATYQFRLPP